MTQSSNFPEIRLTTLFFGFSRFRNNFFTNLSVSQHCKFKIESCQKNCRIMADICFERTLQLKLFYMLYVHFILTLFQVGIISGRLIKSSAYNKNSTKTGTSFNV